MFTGRLILPLSLRYSRRSDKNAAIPGDSHLSLCQTAMVRILKVSLDHRNATILLAAISDSATMVGRQAMPMPKAAHCLIVSTLVNSMMAFGLTFAFARARSSFER